MLKVTSVNSRGCESFPESVGVNESGYISFTEDPEAVSYSVYAPLKGFEETGPWYFKRAYRRSEARRSRFTVVGLYDERDLAPHLLAEHHRYFISLPTPLPGQKYWHVYGGFNNQPYSIIEVPEGAM